jgi:hypothetical protein
MDTTPTPTRRDRILSLVQADPSLAYTDIARDFGVTRQRVSEIARMNGITRHSEKARHDWLDRDPQVLTDAELETLTIERIIGQLESGRIAPGFGKGTPAQRAKSNKRLAAWLRLRLPEVPA